jgi:hypothetical protein
MKPEEYNKTLTFKPHKRDTKIFIETGIDRGGGIEAALECEFEQIHSIDIESGWYNQALDKFSLNKEVNLYLGDSGLLLEDIIKDINEPVFFWLDAHCGSEDAKRVTFRELDIIEAHPIKTHTILVDDVDIYFNQQDLEARVKEINPNYEISYEPTWRNPQAVFVAKI